MLFLENLGIGMYYTFFFNAYIFSAAVVGEKMDEALGTFCVELDGRFPSIRTSETNLGNFICDIIMAACNGDVAILNSGTLRSDRIHPAGDFTMRDLMTVLPMLDPLLVLGVTGEFFQLKGCFPNCYSVNTSYSNSFLSVLKKKS